jgi:carbon-monoxide dehydrogenase medium subunit
MLPEFDLLRPTTLPEALEILTKGGPDVTPLAGGTNVIVDMRAGHRSPRALLDLGKVAELRTIRTQDGHIWVGGGTTIADLLNHPLIAEHGALLREAAAHLGNPLIRNRATLAGNLVDASPAADTAPPLLILDAEVELVSSKGTRRLSLEDFLVGPNETLLRSEELLVAVRWPIPPPQSSGGFRKIGLRKAGACSVVTAAVMVTWNGNHVCHEARIGLGAVAPKPIRPHAAEKALRGQPLTEQVIAEAARLSAEATSPIDDVRGSADYRKRVVEVVVRRLLKTVAAGGEKDSWNQK